MLEHPSLDWDIGMELHSPFLPFVRTFNPETSGFNRLFFRRATGWIFLLVVITEMGSCGGSLQPLQILAGGSKCRLGPLSKFLISEMFLDLLDKLHKLGLLSHNCRKPKVSYSDI